MGNPTCMWTLRDLWSPVEVRDSVARSRDEVFRYIADPETYPDWLVGAQQIRHVDDDFAKPGSGFDHSVGVTPGLTVDDHTEVIDRRGERKLALRVHARPFFEGEVVFELLDRGDSTEIVMREEPIGFQRFLTPVLRPLLAARNRASLRQLTSALA